MKYLNLKELKTLKGKPLYINAIEKSDVYTQGWEKVNKNIEKENINVPNDANKLILARLNNGLFEVYGENIEDSKKKKTYNKIIRDKMRLIIESDCKVATFSIVSGKDKENALRNKLMEETKEFFDTNHISELADILEVIHAICEEKGRSFEEIEEMRLKKKEQKGGFRDGLFLKDIEFND